MLRMNPNAPSGRMTCSSDKATAATATAASTCKTNLSTLPSSAATAQPIANTVTGMLTRGARRSSMPKAAQRACAATPQPTTTVATQATTATGSAGFHSLNPAAAGGKSTNAAPIIDAASPQASIVAGTVAAPTASRHNTSRTPTVV